MNTTYTRPSDDTRQPARPMRLLGVVWLTVAVPVLAASFMLLGVSDHARDRYAGAVLLILVCAAVAVGAMALTAPTRRARQFSLVVSLAWLVGGALVYPTQEFTADALWAAGVPVLGGLVTGIVAWRSPASD